MKDRNKLIWTTKICIISFFVISILFDIYMKEQTKFALYIFGDIFFVVIFLVGTIYGGDLRI